MTTKNKVLALTALDGSVFHIPLEPIIASAAAYYADRMFAGSKERGHAYAVEEFKEQPERLIEWAQNDMNWADVKAHAVRVKLADPIDMADSWVNGRMEVIEVEPAPSAQPAASTPPLAAPTSFAVERSLPNPMLQKLFKGAGLVRGIETSLVLGADADHLAIIHAIATDGLAVEKTQVRRLVLDGIRTACERTLALQQPAQVAA
jgi:hypothetical protein